MTPPNSIPTALLLQTNSSGPFAEGEGKKKKPFSEELQRKARSSLSPLHHPRPLSTHPEPTLHSAVSRTRFIGEKPVKRLCIVLRKASKNTGKKKIFIIIVYLGSKVSGFLEVLIG